MIFTTAHNQAMKHFFFLTSLLLSIQVHAQWDVSTSKDEMTGEVSSYCSSPATPPTKTMSFPYSDVRGWLGVGCNGESEWAYAGFSMAPNLQGTDIGDGYNIITTRIKFDDEVETVRLTQEWNSKFIHFSDDQDVIEKILKANTILLELDWYGSGKTYFRFSGSGSTSSINEIRTSCQ